MTQVDISNRDLLRNVDPIRKAVYDEGSYCFVLASTLYKVIDMANRPAGLALTRSSLNRDV